MDHKIYRKKLHNNMKLLLIPIEHTDTISIGMFIKVGSRYETTYNNGISHFLEHMMFKGTTNFPGKTILENLDNVGAIYNATTSYESTNYYIYGNKNDINLFINIMCEIYMNPLFDENDIMTEKKVVIEELNMYKDDSYDVTINLLQKNVFSNSSLKMPILGTKKNIMSFTRDDLIKFRRKYYTGDRTIMVICGNFNNNTRKKIFNEISKRIQSIKSNKIIKLTKPINYKQIKPLLKVKDHKNIGQTNIIISFRSNGMYSENSKVYDIISNILSSGLSSILFDLLRNKLGIVYNISTYNISYSYEGVFVIYMGVDNKRVNEAIQNVLSIIKSIRTNSHKNVNMNNINNIDDVKKYIDKNDVERAKRMITTGYSLSLQTSIDYMLYYGGQELFYDGKNIKSNLDEYKSINIDKINEVMIELFRPENLNIIIYGIPPLKLSKSL